MNLEKHKNIAYLYNMSRIKSALEIALERTADIKSDATAGKKREWNNSGKKLASDFLSDNDFAFFKKTINIYKKDERENVIEGAVKLFITRIQLPSDEAEISKTMQIGQALELLLPHKNMNELFQMLNQVFLQYIASKEQLEATLTQQYLPKLRQKQNEIAKHTGQQIELTPMQDPEFVQALNRHLDSLKEQYNHAIKEAKNRIANAAELEIDDAE